MAGPQLPQRGTGTKNGLTPLLSVQTLCASLQGEEDKPSCGGPVTISWEERSVRRKTLLLLMDFPRAQGTEQVENEFSGRSYKEANCSSIWRENSHPIGSGCTQEEVGALPPGCPWKVRKPRRNVTGHIYDSKDGEMIRWHQILFQNWGSDRGWYNTVVKVTESECQLFNSLPMQPYTS